MFGKWKTRPPHDDTSVGHRLTALVMTPFRSDRTALEGIFKKAAWGIRTADGLPEAIALLNSQAIPIVVFDRDFPGLDWREAVQQLATGPSPRCVILASFVADDYLWEEVIHLGGYDVLPKPFRESEVIHTIEFAFAALTKSLPSSPRTK